MSRHALLGAMEAGVIPALAWVLWAEVVGIAPRLPFPLSSFPIAAVIDQPSFQISPCPLLPGGQFCTMESQGDT